MFCPNCKAEYVKGITECPECRVRLVEELPPEPEPEPAPEKVELVTVFETSDRMLLMLAKSILEGEGIQYIVIGDTWQDILGLGGTGFTPYFTPVKIQIAKEDEKDARQLLEGINEKQKDNM